MGALSIRSAGEIGELFRRASLDRDGWLAALDAMANATGSLRGQMLGVGSNGDLAFSFMTRIDDSLMHDFLSLSGHHDPMMNYRVAASSRAKVGQIVCEEDYARIKSVTGWTAYEEVCEKHGLPFGCQTTLLNDGEAMVGLALLRTRDEGPTTPEQRALFAAVVPHAMAAASLQTSLEGRGEALVRGTLDVVTTPALLIDGFARVVGMTAAADTMMRGTSLIDVRAGKLRASTAARTRELSALVRSVVTGARSDASILMRGAGEPPLRLTIQTLPRTDWDMGFRPRAIVVLKSAAGDVQGMRETMLRNFGLTMSEAEVALALAAGTPRAQIAEIRGTSLGTVRQQIKTIFHKLAVNREAEFMALIASYSNKLA